MKNANLQPKVGQLARMSMLVAIIGLLTFTPLGFLVIGPISATTIQIPVIIGAILMGPTAGATLGLSFGVASLAKIMMMPGADPFATTILNYNFFLYLTIACVPRIAMGWLSGLLGVAMRKIFAGKRKAIGFAVTGFVGSMMNTVFYLGALWMLASQIVADFYQMDISGVGNMVMGIAVTAGIPEAIASAAIVGAVCRSIIAMDNQNSL